MDNPQTFRGVLVLNDENAWGAARFSIVSPRLEGGEAPGLRFGVENESARLNLAVLLDWDQRRPGAAKEALLALPGMTETIADAILDWLDSDSQPRPFGAEADDYQGRGMPYAPRNGVPQCLEELLLVRGVTRAAFSGHRCKPQSPDRRQRARRTAHRSHGEHGHPALVHVADRFQRRAKSLRGRSTADLRQCRGSHQAPRSTAAGTGPTVGGFHRSLPAVRARLCRRQTNEPRPDQGGFFPAGQILAGKRTRPD